MTTPVNVPGSHNRGSLFKYDIDISTGLANCITSLKDTIYPLLYSSVNGGTDQANQLSRLKVCYKNTLEDMRSQGLSNREAVKLETEMQILFNDTKKTVEEQYRKFLDDEIAPIVRGQTEANNAVIATPYFESQHRPATGYLRRYFTACFSSSRNNITEQQKKLNWFEKNMEECNVIYTQMDQSKVELETGKTCNLNEPNRYPASRLIQIKLEQFNPVINACDDLYEITTESTDRNSTLRPHSAAPDLQYEIDFSTNFSSAITSLKNTVLTLLTSSLIGGTSQAGQLSRLGMFYQNALEDMRLQGLSSQKAVTLENEMQVLFNDMSVIISEQYSEFLSNEIIPIVVGKSDVIDSVRKNIHTESQHRPTTVLSRQPEELNWLDKNIEECSVLHKQMDESKLKLASGRRVNLKQPNCYPASILIQKKLDQFNRALEACGTLLQITRDSTNHSTTVQTG